MDARELRSEPAERIRVAMAAAERAPSVCNTRPWVLTRDGTHITVSADVDRRLDVTDPAARELVISCGAALYNIRTALRAHGDLPHVVAFPDPDRPGLLADVAVTGRVEPSDLERTLFASIRRRRTHRGPFLADVDDVRLVRALSAAATAEEATLHLITDDSLVRSLGGLVAGAEFLHRHERGHAEELARWVRTPDSRLLTGVRAEDFPPTEQTDSGMFPGRDYGGNRIRGLLDVHGEVSGTVAILSTPADTRSSHLSAGQALQRMLLTATAGGVSAAFHTQPLEEPLLRAFITERICGAHPQMIMRLGRAHPHRSALDDEIKAVLAGS
ncbi:Acg family FMN-binding oxidoreductase [Allosalinactinospora lopnorensis]|uniref:Acg family FMN-binding oxidoreductase n=1 Tax=Allosalinactinospora lopnorensis TaxID=1352348 RepID=UPI000623E87A|nr:hypothetical protein [Allosalinactinospora lopnorensis]